MVKLALNNEQQSPWNTRNDWARDFDQLFDSIDRMLSPLRRSNFSTTTNPMPSEVVESDASYLLSLDIPGIEQNDISIECSKGSLTVQAERKNEVIYQQQGTIHRSEKNYGVIQRTFSLPEGVDADRIQANYENGVLYLDIPKAEAAKPKKVEINSGKGGFLKNILGKGDDEKEK